MTVLEKIIAFDKDESRPLSWEGVTGAFGSPEMRRLPTVTSHDKVRGTAAKQAREA